MGGAAALAAVAAVVALPPNNVKITTHGCMLANLTSLPFCNVSLPRDARAKDLVARLTLSEKISLVSSKSSPVPRLGLPAYNWGVEDDHGAGTACLAGTDGAQHCPTIFPTLSIVAASFNSTLWERVGRVIGTEVRAANNVGATRARSPKGNAPIGVNGWGPNLNIQRDPRWGRNSEVPSEDSFLAGKVGAALTRGIQGDGNGGEYVLLLGVVKHVTAYSLENWRDDTGGPRNGTAYSRFGFAADINRHDLAETYLEAHRIAITEGNALGMMCSYMSINGTASCENPHLLNTWARGSQGFEGNVVTDCGALSMSTEPKSAQQSAADALNAGTDLNCGKVFGGGLQGAIAAGLTTEAALDASLERTFGLLMRAGYFDPLEMQPYAAIPPEAVGTAASHELARQSALQGLVLLKNDPPAAGKNRQAGGGDDVVASGAAPAPAPPALPLAKGKVTAVIGPLANATLALVSRYYDAVCPGPLNPKLPWSKGERPSGCIKSPLAQIRQRGGTVLHESGVVCTGDRPGMHCVTSTSTAAVAGAVAAAKQADQIVAFVGTDHSVETEGTDRQALTLPGVQAELLAAVRVAAPSTPLTVVLLNGGAIAFDSSGADAVVEAFFPGIEGGEALACALFGESGCNRWGRLPVTVFPASFAKNDMANMGVSTGGSGLRTYRYYDGGFGAPIHRFGEGLSLATFELGWPGGAAPAPAAVSATQNASVIVTVRNTHASREGDCVVLLFWAGDSGGGGGGGGGNGSRVAVPAGTPVPRLKLVGFDRVGVLGPGASATVTFGVAAEQLALVDANGDTRLFAGTHVLRVWLGSGAALEQAFDVREPALLRELAW